MRLKLLFFYAFVFISLPLATLASTTTNVKEELNSSDTFVQFDSESGLKKDFFFNVYQNL